MTLLKKEMKVEEKNSNKNLILFFVIMLTMFMIFRQKNEDQVDTDVKSETVKKESEKKDEKSIKSLAIPTNLTTHFPDKRTEPIGNEKLFAEASSKQGRLTQLSLVDKKYKHNIKQDANKESEDDIKGEVRIDKEYSGNIDMLAALTGSSYFPNVSSIFKEEPGYKLVGRTQNSVKFSFSHNSLEEIKEVSLLDNYRIDVLKTIKNNSSSPVNYTPSINLTSIHKHDDLFASIDKQFHVIVKSKDIPPLILKDNDDLKDSLPASGNIEWSGIDYGFFILSSIHDEKEITFLKADFNEKDNTVSIVSSQKETIIQPGASKTFTFSLYVGPKEISLLEKAGSHLDESINYGGWSWIAWWQFLPKTLLWILNIIYTYIFSNYGVAIILLTFFIKMLLWPLTNASYKSMNKMKALQPKLKALKDKYGDDKETYNKEMMMLYKQEGVNPLGGCLPMFLQMPVYIALWRMLSISVEIYNAPFLPFWLTNLSSKDPYYILPFLLGGVMFLQQKMMPQQGMDNQQAKIMMYAMPVVFTAFMFNLPSGLVLYIFVNTLLGIIQQKAIKK